MFLVDLSCMVVENWMCGSVEERVVMETCLKLELLSMLMFEDFVEMMVEKPVAALMAEMMFHRVEEV